MRLVDHEVLATGRDLLACFAAEYRDVYSALLDFRPENLALGNSGSTAFQATAKILVLQRCDGWRLLWNMKYAVHYRLVAVDDDSVFAQGERQVQATDELAAEHMVRIWVLDHDFPAAARRGFCIETQVRVAEDAARTEE